MLRKHFSIHYTLKLFICSIFFMGCNPSENDFSKLKLSWQFVKNATEDGKPYGIARFIFINEGKNPINTGKWHIDFNQITFFESSEGDKEIGIINHINGYLNRFTPGQAFMVLPGDSLIYEYKSSEPLIKSGYAPRGAYVVDGQKVIELPKIDISGFENLENVFPDPDILANVPNAKNTFEHNKLIGSFAANSMRSKIIPEPESYKNLTVPFILSSDAILITDQELNNEADFLIDYLQRNFGFALRNFSSDTARGTDEKKQIKLTIDSKIQNVEGYFLHVTEKAIEIKGGSPSGVFYGIQSLLQLIPEGHFREKGKDIYIEGIQISDAPRFEYRGFLLDVARNFLPKDNVLKLIDLLSFYKVNKLNIRLTEDEGWRVEIKDLPELTEIGSKRGHSTITNTYLQPAFGSGPYPSKTRDFYTVEEYKEIVKYAAQRHVEIIPEICFPSHARAAIVSMEVRHQRLARAGKVKEAEEFRLADPEDKSVYRSAQGFRDNIANVARPSVYHFYETVVKALIQMHNEAGAPLKTFNTGGDEVPYGAWSASPMAKDLLKTLPEGSNSVQLQGTFLEKALTMLSKYNLRVTGWEEIVLKKNQGQKPAVDPKFVGKNVMPLVWDNTNDNVDLGYRIANAGYPVVLCNVTSLYADLAYDSDPDESGLYWGGFTNNFDPFYTAPFDVFKTGNYSFWGKMQSSNPDYSGRERLRKDAYKNIKGISIQLWSETLTEGPEMFEYFIVPKLFAFSEKAWSKASAWESEENVNKRNEKLYNDWASLTHIIGSYHLPRLELWNGGYNYRVSPPGVAVIDGKIQVNNEFSSFITRYTTDGSDPDSNSPVLENNMNPQKNMKVRAFSSGGRKSKVFTVVND